MEVWNQYKEAQRRVYFYLSPKVVEAGMLWRDRVLIYCAPTSLTQPTRTGTRSNRSIIALVYVISAHLLAYLMKTQGSERLSGFYLAPKLEYG